MFLKVCNVDKFFKSSSREFHSLMDDGIHDFCEIQVLFKGNKIFLLFLRGQSEISLLRGGIQPRIYDGTMPALTLFMKDNLRCCLLCDRVVYLHSLYRFSNDTDLLSPVTRRVALFWIFCNVCESSSEHPSNITGAYSTIGNR